MILSKKGSFLSLGMFGMILDSHLCFHWDSCIEQGVRLDGLKWTHPVLGFHKASVGWIDWLVCPQPIYGFGNSWDYGRACSWPGISVFPAFGAL